VVSTTLIDDGGLVQRRQGLAVKILDAVPRIIALDPRRLRGPAGIMDHAWSRMRPWLWRRAERSRNIEQTEAGSLGLRKRSVPGAPRVCERRRRALRPVSG